MSHLIHDSTTALTRFAPEACPNAAGNRRFLAHRRLPSMMMPTCFGRGLDDKRIHLLKDKVILQLCHSLKRPLKAAFG